MRKKELVLEVIAETLESIVEENEIILSYKESIPQIELDMILGNIRKLYENYRLLDKYNLEEAEILQHAAMEAVREPVPEPVTEKTVPEETTPVAETADKAPATENHIRIGFFPKKIILPEPEAGEQQETEPVREEAAETEPEPIVEPIPEPEEEPEPEPVVAVQEVSQLPVEEEPAVEIEEPVESTDEKKIEITLDLFSDQPMTVADKYRKDEKTVNERISPGPQEESIASVLERSQIPDLKSTIGLNDKFIFINELFHGNMKAYLEAITTLDQFTRLNDAIRYFNELTEAFEMKEDLPSFKRFAEMIRRKFQ
jgi:hypothetical protein